MKGLIITVLMHLLDYLLIKYIVCHKNYYNLMKIDENMKRNCCKYAILDVWHP